MKPICLSNAEINVISVITQQRGLPHKFLLEQARKCQLSRDGMAVVRAVLGTGRSARAAEVARDFTDWAEKL